jgi:formate hydrogenlyase subunit 3/multisubunit Na+/H+ antiporter MnhD subunit
LWKVLLFGVQCHSVTLQLILVLIAFLSVFIGSVLIMFETNFFRFFTLASLVQAGLILFNWSCLTNEALVVGGFYAIIYLLFLLGFFAICGSMSIRNFGYKWWLMPFSFTQIFEFSWLSGVLLIVFLTSFIGLPPFLLFFVKLHIFIELYENYYVYSFIFLIIMNAFTCAYYLLVILLSTQPTGFTYYTTLNLHFISPSDHPDGIKLFIFNVDKDTKIENLLELYLSYLEKTLLELPKWLKTQLYVLYSLYSVEFKYVTLLAISIVIFFITLGISLNYDICAYMLNIL